MEFRGIFDVTNAHRGFEVSSQVSYQPQFLPVEFGIGARFRDKRLKQYLFGIDPADTTQEQLEFSAQSELTTFVTGMLALPLSEHLISYGKFVYEELGSLSDSPLVPDDGVSELTLGVVYQWK